MGRPSARSSDGRLTSPPRNRCRSSSWRRRPPPMPELRSLVAAELKLPVDHQVTAMAAAIAAKHGAASRAVLFYGSCLREKQLDGLMLDFYLIVSDYRAAYGKKWLAAANRLIPLNVLYFEDDGLAAQYAVLSGGDFEDECSLEAWTVSNAPRFLHPSRLVSSQDKAAADRVADSVSQAPPPLLAWALPGARD